MDKLNLANIQALAASIDYGGRGLLQPSSAALGLSAALFLSNLNLWQGADYEKTDAEIDDIQAMVAQLENDLIEAGEMYPTDRCKLTMLAPQAIPTVTYQRLYFDVELYDPSDMHSLIAVTERIYVQQDGLHLINAAINFYPNIVGDRRLYLLKKDPVLPDAQGLVHDEKVQNSVVRQTALEVCAQDYAVAGTYYYLLAYQSSPGDLVVMQDDYGSWFSVVRM